MELHQFTIVYGCVDAPLIAVKDYTCIGLTLRKRNAQSRYWKRDGLRRIHGPPNHSSREPVKAQEKHCRID